jgi:hypothetical protein
LLLSFLFINSSFSLENISNLTVLALDKKQSTVQSISFPDGHIISERKFIKVLTPMILNPDKSRLVVLTEGSKKNAVSLHVVNPQNMEIYWSFKDIGWKVIEKLKSSRDVYGAWDSSGKILTIIFWGHKKHKPEVVQVDIFKGNIVGRIPIDCTKFFILPPTQVIKGEKIVLTYKGEGTTLMQLMRNKTPVDTYRLLIINLHNILDSKDLTLNGYLSDKMAVSPDKSFFYVNSIGLNLKEIDKSMPTTGVHVISTATDNLVEEYGPYHQIGEPYIDTVNNYVIFPCIRPMSNDTPHLAVFKGKDIIKEIPLGDKPFSITKVPKTHKLFVSCYNSIYVLNSESFEILGVVKDINNGKDFWKEKDGAALQGGYLSFIDESKVHLFRKTPIEIYLDTYTFKDILEIEVDIRSNGSWITKTTTFKYLPYIFPTYSGSPKVSGGTTPKNAVVLNNKFEHVYVEVIHDTSMLYVSDDDRATKILLSLWKTDFGDQILGYLFHTPNMLFNFTEDDISNILPYIQKLSGNINPKEAFAKIFTYCK